MQSVARETITVAIDQHMALCIEFFGLLVKGQFIGLHHHVVTTDRGITLYPQHRVG